MSPADFLILLFNKVFASYYSMQPARASTPVEFADGKWIVKDKAGKECKAKSVRLSKDYTGTALIKVHLAADPVNEYEVFDFVAGDNEGLIFDEIIQDGTSADFTKIKVFC